MLAFVVQTFDRIYTLDPHTAFDGSSRHAVVNLYDTLYDVNEDGLAEPAIATCPLSYAEVDGRVRALISIRDGIAFHDGSQLRVEDVLYSLRRSALLNNGLSSLWHDVLLGEPEAHPSDSALAEMYDRFHALESAVGITLDKPFGPLEKFLAQWALVLPRKWCIAEGGWSGELSDLPRVRSENGSPLDRLANGSGPYRLGKLGEAGDDLTLERHENYWRDIGDVDVVHFVAEGERSAREGSLTSGASDFAVCQPESLERMTESTAYVLERLPDEWSINPLGFINQSVRAGSDCLGSGEWGADGHPADAFSDLSLRRMLNHSFNHDLFVTRALDAQVMEHRVPFPAPARLTGSRKPPQYDLNAARNCWELAWDGEAKARGMHLFIDTHQDNVSRLIAAEILSEGLRSIDSNIHVTVRNMQLGELTDRLYAGDMSVAWIGWAGDYADPYAFASTLVCSSASIPSALGIRDEVIDDALANARSAEDRATAYQHYETIADRTADLSLFITPPGKVSYMTYARRWADVFLRNQIPHSLDYRRIRAR